MNLIYRIVGSLAIIAIFFYGTLQALDYLDRRLPLCPSGPSTPLVGAFSRFGPSGYAYVAQASQFDQFADRPADGARSDFRVCEDDRLLGPPHSPDVASRGKGRFSHWQGIGFIFSSSDNTDPNTNGRRYSVVAPSP